VLGSMAIVVASMGTAQSGDVSPALSHSNLQSINGHSFSYVQENFGSNSFLILLGKVNTHVGMKQWQCMYTLSQSHEDCIIAAFFIRLICRPREYIHADFILVLYRLAMHDSTNAVVNFA